MRINKTTGNSGNKAFNFFIITKFDCKDSESREQYEIKQSFNFYCRSESYLGHWSKIAKSERNNKLYTYKSHIAHQSYDSNYLERIKIKLSI